MSSRSTCHPQVSVGTLSLVPSPCWARGTSITRTPDPCREGPRVNAPQAPLVLDEDRRERQRFVPVDLPHPVPPRCQRRGPVSLESAEIEEVDLHQVDPHQDLVHREERHLCARQPPCQGGSRMGHDDPRAGPGWAEGTSPPLRRCLPEVLKGAGCLVSGTESSGGAPIVAVWVQTSPPVSDVSLAVDGGSQCISYTAHLRRGAETPVSPSPG